MVSGGKFLPVKSDVLFRLFFADERNGDCLIDFLKSVLRLPEDDYDEIEIADPNLLPEYPGDKLGVIDVKLRTRSRKTIHIEIQLSIIPQMRERIMFYSAKLVTEQIGGGEPYSVIKRVISILITDERLIPDSQKYHHRFTLYDPAAGVELSDLLEINTLELEKLPEGADGTALYDWARFIAAESKEELAMIENPQVKKAVVKYLELTADERARDLYERREKERRDIMSREMWARLEGKQEGMREGKREEKWDVAKNALQMNFPVDDIAKLTGLTLEEIASLRSQ